MRKLFLIVTLTILALPLCLGGADSLAQSFPSHPIQLIIPGGAGDAQDVVARSMAEELSKILKVTVVPTNKPGGAQTIGTDFVAKSKKDGYTILYSSASALVFSPASSPETTPYNPLKDFEYLGMNVSLPSGMFVQADSPWNTFSDVIEHARKNPGGFRGGTNGVASTSHFQMEVVKGLTGVDMPMIPFKGVLPAYTALMGGHIESAWGAVALAYPFIESKKMRAIILDTKVPALSEVPTLRDLGYKRDLPKTYWAFYAPAGIPEEVKKVLVSAVEKVSKNEEILAKLKQMHLIPNYRPPAEQKQILTEDYESAREMARKMGLTK